MKKIFLSTCLYLCTFIGSAQTTVLTDNFANTNKFYDLSHLVKWGSNTDYYVSAFTLTTKTDNNGLSYPAITLTPEAVANSGYELTNSLKTATAFEYALPYQINRQNNIIRIEFDAIWETLDPISKSGENGRLVVTLNEHSKYNMWVPGIVEDLSAIEPFGEPKYNIRLRNTNNTNTSGAGAMMLYGGGTVKEGEWEKKEPLWWLPGFSQQAGAGSPGSSEDFPLSGTKKKALVTNYATTTTWKRFTWISYEDRLELYARNSADNESTNQLVLKMSTPNTSDTIEARNIINAFHSTNATYLPPLWQYHPTFNGIRFYFRGVHNMWLANISVTATNVPTVLPLRIENFQAIPKGHQTAIIWKIQEVNANSPIQIHIQGSDDGIHFNNITTLNQAPLMGRSIVPNKAYYRLLCMNQQQEKTYSSILKLPIKQITTVKLLHATGQNSLQIQSKENEIFNLSIIDLQTGSKFHRQVESNKSIILPMQHMQNYLFQVTKDNDFITQQKVIW